MGANNTRLTPRQKMINLMYIVLTAMLALNVSSDVLDGFTQVHEGLKRSNTNFDTRNTAIYGQLESLAEQNPGKGQAWLDKATEVRQATASLYNYIDTLKHQIVQKADGKDGDPDNILNRDDLESAAVIMLAPGNPRGRDLRLRVDGYRDFVADMIPDTVKRNTIAEVLSTAPIVKSGTLTPQRWEEAKFDQQPVVAAVTLLSKLQSDLLYAEGEVLASLLSQVDAGDLRVNELNAYVMPQSRLVMRGGKYSANIVLAAVDTTQRPRVFIQGKPLDNNDGLYEVSTGATGNFDYTGWLEVSHGDGSTTRHDFKSSYTVIEPMATVSATLMNVLYAGIDNPLSISVPGVAMTDISASMTNGTLTRSGDSWVARPSAVGQDAVVTVTANMDGRPVTMAATKFRVRKLPDPSPYIAFRDKDGNEDHYKGGKPFPKAMLLASPGLGAAIDDGLLDTPFEVEGFETVFFDSSGNAMPEVSAGSQFSPRQKAQFQRLSRGKRFYISRIRAKGPDGITRDLSPMEVIIN
ncbi:MAG: gliding motility protein GldM [Muribaculaceae bacterium]|nr:gliding motility protein GldM [Muribaculaceae bacterium]